MTTMQIQLSERESRVSMSEILGRTLCLRERDKQDAAMVTCENLGKRQERRAVEKKVKKEKKREEKLEQNIPVRSQRL